MKKGFKRLGMFISIVIIIVGICVLSGAISGSPSYASDASVGYDSGYAIFGADFYNYVCNNSAEAASAARAAANNIIDVADNVINIGGILLIALGALGFCFFGMMPTGAFKVEFPVSAAPVPAAAPIAAPVPVAEPAPVAEPTPEEIPAPAAEAAVEEKAEAEALPVEETEA